jgi:hypothetical protein
MNSWMSALPAHKAAPLAEHESYWFFVKNNASHGPFTAPEIERRIQEGDLRAHDFCWRQGFEEWRPLSGTKEFHQAFTEFAKDPLYPKIEVPSRLEQKVVASLTKKDENQNRRKVVVQLAKAKMYYFSLYEWTAALLFSLGLAFASCLFVLGEVRENFFTRLLKDRMGELREVGEASKTPAMNLKMMAPLLSAPGAEAHPFPVELAWESYAQIENFESRSFEMDAHVVTSQEALLSEAEFRKNLDDVYRYPIKVHGQIFLKAPRDVLVNNPGSPLVFSH